MTVNTAEKLTNTVVAEVTESIACIYTVVHVAEETDSTSRYIQVLAGLKVRIQTEVTRYKISGVSPGHT